MAENFPPYVISSMPYRNVVWPAPASFRVTIGDPNPGDTIHFRWVADYPPYRDETRLLYQGALALGPASSVDLAYDTWVRDAQGTLRPCDGFVPGAEHRLVLIVSDRPFRPARSTEEMFRYNTVENDATFPVMIGWNLFNCPP